MSRAPRTLLYAVAFSLMILGSHAASRAEDGPSLEVDGLVLTAVDGRMQLTRDGRVLLASPPEGPWSIATDWADDWPTAWRHASPESIERVGPWLVARGTLETDAGVWEIRDAYRPVAGADAIRCTRRWTWTGERTAERTTLSVRWRTPEPNGRLVLPGNCYFGNPSGVAAAYGVVPRFDGAPGEDLYVEEHRCPMPFACVEANGAAATLHALPCPAPRANVRDQWWTIGASGLDDATELALLSGPVAMNGRRGVVKGRQRELHAYGDTWIDARPGDVIEKTFHLEAFPVERPGSGFQRSVRASIALFEPTALEGMPSTDEILADKYRFAKSRWHEGPDSAGFRMFPHNNEYVMGWAGQSEAPGFALLALRERFGREGVTMAARSLDFLATSPMNEDGFLIRFDPDGKGWYRQDPVSQGQAMYHFALAIEMGRNEDDVHTTPWEGFLRGACDVHAARILKDDWRPKSTNEGFVAAALCKAYELFGVPVYKQAGLKAADHYAARHLDMTEPYWGGTLDARCEDKEGAWAGFQAFLAAYDMTRDRKYLDYAEHAMDVALTYTCVWDIEMPAGRLADHRLKTRGWTAVSVQNQHLDVYAVVFTPEIHRMGDLLGREDLRQLARVMYRSCGQMIDPDGSQGEQLNQTSYVQFRGLADDVHEMRGTYAEKWTVLWMTAHFLTAAGKFEMMGVTP